MAASGDSLHRPPFLRSMARLRMDAAQAGDVHDLFHQERRRRAVLIREARERGAGSLELQGLRARKKLYDRLISEVHRVLDDLGVEWIEAADEPQTVTNESALEG